MVSLNDIQKLFRGEIKLGESLASHSSFRIGGSADFYLEPRNKDEVVRLVNYFQRQDIPFVMLGQGDNILVSDQGYRGAVINLENALSHVFMDGPLLYVETGVKIAKLVDFCVHRSLKGMEHLAGIPGTLATGLLPNAIVEDVAIDKALVETETLWDGALVRIRKGDAGFDIRSSTWSTEVPIAAWFSLNNGEKGELIRARREWLVKRNQAQPVNVVKPGNIFKNPPGQFAATLIEAAGLDGVRHGNAVMSVKQENVIVHTGRSNALDVLMLIKKVQRAVQRKFRITLELNVRLLGFDQMTLREVA